MYQIDSFEKKHDFLLCIDSDGCVMDTMNTKHIYCFGPCLIEEWELDAVRNEVLSRWNEINLFQMTRGINRFKGLSMILSEIDERYKKIPGADMFRTWVQGAEHLSNAALRDVMESMPESEERNCFSKALRWSESVNRAVDDLPLKFKVPFSGAKEILEKARGFADIAVVSSSNRGAICDEWKLHGLYEYIDIILDQEYGSKSECVSKMMKFGYNRSRVLMIGDAPGDMYAAEQNSVCFFPILVNYEEESWQELKEVGLPSFISDAYIGKYQADKRAEFLKNLS